MALAHLAMEPPAADAADAADIAALLAAVPRTALGGLRVAVLDRTATADLMIAAAQRPRVGPPPIFTSANGEVLSRAARDRTLREIMQGVDVISADGQSLVFASRLIGRHVLPERVATTDLFHDVARRALARGATFYLLGATEEENRRAAERAASLYPGLRIVGRAHGFLDGPALERTVDEIDALGPDILWVALGVPRQQVFCRRYAARLSHVGAIKTCGGLFNFLSGASPRAPQWMQAACLEWLYRTLQEPRRLAWRYLSTNPHAIYLMLTRSG